MDRIEHDWRSMAALNVSSTLAQVGQFGIPFIVLPLWLEHYGATTLQLSLFASSLWAGQLPGLYWAPHMTRRFGAKRVIVLALLSTVFAMLLLGTGSPSLWLAAGFLAGWGQGLRWIGLEPWLYNIAPGHARGRLVGFHESLIALAPIVAPTMCGWLGIEGRTPLLLGAGFALIAAVPLLWATEEPRVMPAEASTVSASVRRKLPRDAIFLAGVVIALFGGMSESAFAGLFAIYGKARELDSGSIASLLIAFGLGGLLLQYFAGWLADRRGVAFACLSCSIGGIIVATMLTLLLNTVLLYLAVFALGGLVTGYLTLALIAGAKTPHGDMAHNISVISMVYTATAIVGPPIAGGAIKLFGGNGLMWALAGFAILMTAALRHVSGLTPPLPHSDAHGNSATG